MTIKKLFSNKIYRFVAPLLIAALAVGGLALAPAPVFAQSGGPTPQATSPSTTASANPDAVLAKAYQREQTWLGKQADNLAKANNAVTKAQDLIDQAREKGKDVSALEAALAVFQSQLATAQSAHDTAAALLSDHAGFDDGGNVTGRAAARQTVLDARQSLGDAHRLLRQGVVDLGRAVRAWRAANNAPAPTQTVTD